MSSTESTVLAQFIRIVAVIALLAIPISSAEAQQPYEGVPGRLLDAAGEPLAGHRVMFQPADGNGTFLSQPTRADGSFVVSLPRGGEFVPVELVTAKGQRIRLEDQPSVTADPDSHCDIRLAPAPGEEPPAPPPPADEPEAEAEATAEAPPAAEEEELEAGLNGRLNDLDGNPLVGYRLAFREKDSDAIWVSGPTDQEGNFFAAIPDGAVVLPIAQLSQAGRRMQLEEQEAVEVTTSAHLELELPSLEPKRPLPEPIFPGADRLFLAFVEDTAVVEHWRGEFQLEIADADSSDLILGRAIGAVQFAGMPDVEWGGRIGLGASDNPQPVGDVSGASDLELWGKLNLGDRPGGTRLAAGFIMQLPTGEQAPGLGLDALSVKLFFAGRRVISRGVLSYNAGLRVSESAKLGGLVIDDKVALSIGAGWLLPLNERMVVVTEASWETERYDGFDSDLRILGGLNWRAIDLLTVRTALAFGLTDGAPDFQLLAGVSFDY